MSNREKILQALQPLQDPVYQKSMVELQLIRDILVKDDRISLTVVLSTEVEAKKSELEQDIRQRLSSMTSNVHIRFRQMTEFEQAEIARMVGSHSSQQTQASHRGQQAGQHSHSMGMISEMLKPQSGTEFIAIASGKGGVGKSTVTVNLAVALARKGKRVGIIDADIYGFSVPDMMGIEERPRQEDEKIIPVERFGVKVMSMGFFVEDNAPVIWRGPMLGRMLRNFFTEIEWGPLDIMLLDLPPGTGDIALDVHQMIPQSKEILVTTPHATAAYVAARAGAMALKTEHEILGVVENMSYFECAECGSKQYVFGRGGGAKLAQELHTELLAQIPLCEPDNHPSEPDFSPSVYKEDTAIGTIYAEVAERVIQKLG